jgi:ribosome maturation factor RimP
LPRHWRRNVGRLVTVTTSDGASLTGRVVAADEGAVTLQDTGGSAARQVRLVEVAKARVQVELNRKDG